MEYNEIEYYGEKAMRWYQVAARNMTIKALQDGKKRILINLPTGAGKTITSAATLDCPEMRQIFNITDRKLRVLFIAYNHNLLSQADKTFIADSNVELILQSMMSPIPQAIIDQGWDICVLDEAHREACYSMQLQLEALGDIPMIGLTATPDRADGLVIKFEEFINPISRYEAVQQGYLAETYLHTIVDGSEKSKADIVIDILNEYHYQMQGTLIFVRTKKEAIRVNDYLLLLGRKSVALLDQDSKTTEQLLNDFSNKKIEFIVSCKRLNEGIDLAGCSTVVVGMTVSSYPMLNQIIGRASRPDCDCNIWEIVNPLSKNNLDTTCVTGTPAEHLLIYFEKQKWRSEKFDYTS